MIFFHTSFIFIWFIFFYIICQHDEFIYMIDLFLCLIFVKWVTYAFTYVISHDFLFWKIFYNLFIFISFLILYNSINLCSCDPPCFINFHSFLCDYFIWIVCLFFPCDLSTWIIFTGDCLNDFFTFVWFLLHYWLIFLFPYVINLFALLKQFINFYQIFIPNIYYFKWFISLNVICLHGLLIVMIHLFSHTTFYDSWFFVFIRHINPPPPL